MARPLHLKPYSASNLEPPPKIGCGKNNFQVVSGGELQIFLCSSLVPANSALPNLKFLMKI